MAKPIVPWLGGKSRLANKLLPLFPVHSCYVELFCGGAALFFLREVPASTSALNDINGELVNLYRVVINHMVEFCNQFRLAINSREIFEWHKVTPPETLTDIQRAARFYYLQQHAFSGKVANQTWGTATTSPSFNLMGIEEKLTQACMRLSGVYIERLPWLDCAKKYDRSHTFHFADPPYWQTEGYGVEFGLEQYQAMAGFMRTCKGKMMVTINDHPAMREVFQGFRVVELSIKYSVSNNNGKPKTSTELVVMNY